VRLEKRLDAGDTAVVGDATQLHQVAMNLCTNALQAMEHGGVLTVVLNRESVPSAACSRTAPCCRSLCAPLGERHRSGIAPAVLERMFDPFFTTKAVGDGTGWAVTRARHRGRLRRRHRCGDAGGCGTSFTVWLPTSGETPRLLAEPVGSCRKATRDGDDRR